MARSGVLMIEAVVPVGRILAARGGSFVAGSPAWGVGRGRGQFPSRLPPAR